MGIGKFSKDTEPPVLVKTPGQANEDEPAYDPEHTHSARGYHRRSNSSNSGYTQSQTPVGSNLSSKKRAKHHPLSAVSTSDGALPGHEEEDQGEVSSLENTYPHGFSNTLLSPISPSPNGNGMEMSGNGTGLNNADTGRNQIDENGDYRSWNTSDYSDEDDGGFNPLEGHDDGYYTQAEVQMYEKQLPSEQPHRKTIRWKKGDLLGSGAFGRVYTALDQDTGELISVKQIMINTKQSKTEEQHAVVETLRNEISMMSSLDHPSIVRYLGTEEDADCVWILMEYVSGGSLASIVKKFGALNENLIRTYVRQILSGLIYLHDHMIVHRDVKCANILLDLHGTCKLSDFGASKRMQTLASSKKEPASLQGTPWWMAPEVIRQIGHGRKADIWSLGCSVIELATGQPPWGHLKNPLAAMFHIASSTSPPPLPSSISGELRDFILSCLRYDPDERPTARALMHHPLVEKTPLFETTHTFLDGRSHNQPAGETHPTDGKRYNSNNSRTSDSSKQQSVAFVKDSSNGKPRNSKKKKTKRVAGDDICDVNSSGVDDVISGQANGDNPTFASSPSATNRHSKKSEQLFVNTSGAELDQPFVSDSGVLSGHQDNSRGVFSRLRSLFSSKHKHTRNSFEGTPRKTASRDEQSVKDWEHPEGALSYPVTVKGNQYYGTSGQDRLSSDARKSNSLRKS
eukprot:gb/GECG01008321.1/.p1 GENE.gb/GECG01008321.1/~~gb/GECG01008321.1/.p1  ORF type:complete len:685 (+),score=86.14 gb/GECG01008321.1/:1-2055(+)